MKIRILSQLKISAAACFAFYSFISSAVLASPVLRDEALLRHEFFNANRQVLSELANNPSPLPTLNRIDWSQRLSLLNEKNIDIQFIDGQQFARMQRKSGVYVSVSEDRLDTNYINNHDSLIYNIDDLLKHSAEDRKYLNVHEFTRSQSNEDDNYTVTLMIKYYTEHKNLDLLGYLKDHPPKLPDIKPTPLEVMGGSTIVGGGGDLDELIFKDGLITGILNGKYDVEILQLCLGMGQDIRAISFQERKDFKIKIAAFILEVPLFEDSIYMNGWQMSFHDPVRTYLGLALRSIK